MGQADARDSYCSPLSTQVVGAGFCRFFLNAPEVV